MIQRLELKLLLEQAVRQSLLRPLDYHFACRLAGDDQPLLLLLAAWVSAETGSGNVCLPLLGLDRYRLFGGRQAELAESIWQAVDTPGLPDWLEALQQSAAVSDGSQPTPLVLEGNRLYLQRLWQDEGRVATFFRHPPLLNPVDDQAVAGILDQLFGVWNPIVTDWQKVAAALAVSSGIAVISGGPGTGKTTTVARVLTAFIRLAAGRKQRIRLAAPTGKAAARLTESLNQALQQLALTAEERAQFPQETLTLHRLLGAQYHTRNLRYHAGNRLHVDLLIVDEASMIDLPMMARLVEALPPSARLILLGDRDQLASVEAGSVLGDICWFARYGFSTVKAAQLSRLTGYSLSSQPEPKVSSVSDAICLLQTSYRFSADSGIGQLALAVNSGDALAALACLDRPWDDIDWLAKSADDFSYLQVLQTAVKGYAAYLRCCGGPVASVLAAFNRFRLLCALRGGPYGVEHLNRQIEQALNQAGLIDLQAQSGDWYLGKPVMIERNDSRLGLANGDIGIALPDDSGQLRIHFLLPEGRIVAIHPNRLPAYSTAYALTIHKSQGSEFEHTLLLLPTQKPLANNLLPESLLQTNLSPLLTRELLYTAITRARHKLTLCADEATLRAMILSPIERHSGLIARLYNEI